MLKICGVVGRIDMAITIGITLKIITDWLKLPIIPTIMCTDLYSLYKCLVKLGTTKEKCFIIDIMALQQSYEWWEFFEIQWINSQDNLTDAITKINPTKALKVFINTNTLCMWIKNWVKRE